MKKLRVGVIGLGIGQVHITGYLSHPGAEVVALADMNKDRLQTVADKFKVAKRYISAREMLDKEGLDVVSIATPNKFHKPLALAAFKAGCHVLCEKPMAMSAADGREMISASKKAGKRLMIDFSTRFTDQSWSLKKEVEAGVLGDIYFARTVWHRRRGIPGFGGWFGQKALAGGGPLIDLGVHRLDLALWLMNYPKPEWVMGSAYNKIAAALAKKEGKAFDVEDLAAGFVKFKNGASLEVEASWAANIAEREFMETRLYGTKGGLVQRNIGEGYNSEAEIFLEREGGQFDMKFHSPVRSMKGAMHHFITCIQDKTPHMATGEEGLIVMELLDAIYLSARKGVPVKIK
ncbi:MAG: Gfo/Idh/MocA family oxidoreductase [Kiritimatiellae bacterium]|nr:Gfo/Idh/MocA family oxidoreductase [Kiritimatiellia bacterium]